jgi:YbgC/YbaW family acyl-CoA thioester hydrolase
MDFSRKHIHQNFSNRYAVSQANIAERQKLRQNLLMPESLPTHESREEVMFFDTDCGQVVHNIAYLRMIETCRTRLAAKLGMDLRTMSETHIYPVLTRTEIDYKRPAKLGDWLLIRGRLVEFTRARFWCAFEMVRESDGAVLVTARQALALVQMPEGKPMRLPNEWAERWGAAGGAM